MSQETPTDVPRRILVVDDDADGAETLAIVLRSAGHDVRVASDGPAALDVAIDFRPDVVFLDVGMPGMAGFDHFLVKPAPPKLLREIAMQARPPSEPPRGTQPAR